jgi:dTMP kinase
MNASRAQLVREVIRPALAAGGIVLCDRFYDSTTAYQGHGRRLDLKTVQTVIDFAVGETRPHLTLLMHISPEVSEARRRSRQSILPFLRDRMEEADRQFFERVAKGYQLIAAAEPERVKLIDATADVEAVSAAIWKEVSPLLGR